MFRKRRRDETKQGQIEKEEANFMAEEAIINDKERFGRVRASLMEYLRAKYGYRIADRALHRVNKRMQKNYFNAKNFDNNYR